MIDVAIQRLSQVTVMTLDGELTYETEAKFKRLLRIANRPMQPYIIINCKNLSGIDSTGLGALVALSRELSSRKNSGGYVKPVKLCCIPPYFRDELRASRLDRIFQIFPSEEEARASISCKSILLIDDSQDAIQLMSAFFGLQGHDLTVIQNKRQLMQHLSHGEHDLLVIDPGLQSANGWDMLDMLCKSWSIPVIVTSSAPAEEALQHASILHWFNKPYDAIRFLETIQTALMTKRLKAFAASRDAAGQQEELRTRLDQFGANIRYRRMQLHFSQAELANRAALDRTYINKIEVGRQNISLKNLFKIARALHTTAARLLDDIP